MHFKNFQIAIRAIVLVSSFGFCGVAAATTTSITENPGAYTTFFSTTALNGMDTIGSILFPALNPAGGGSSSLPGVKRFALPGQGKTGAAGAAGGNLWNAWFAYSRSNLGFEFAPLSSSGKVDVYLAGVDYTSGNKVFGVALARDNTDIDLNFNGGKLKGSGWTVSPYVGIALNNQWVFDATLGFGRTDVDTTALGVSGSTETDRTMGSLGLTFRNNVGNWQLTARGAYLAVHDQLGAYTLSNGTLVPDGSVRVSQLRLSGQVAYNAGNITPYIGLAYINDLSRPDQAPVGGVAAANDNDAWTPTIGLRFKSDGSVYGSVQYSSERSRQEVRNNQFQINLGVRF